MQKLLVPQNGSGNIPEASLKGIESIDLIDKKNPALPAAASV